jgi:hypothetical protein
MFSILVQGTLIVRSLILKHLQVSESNLERFKRELIRIALKL